jgi:hypothetical protein
MAALDKNGERVSLVTMTPKGYQETKRKASFFKKDRGSKKDQKKPRSFCKERGKVGSII